MSNIFPDLDQSFNRIEDNLENLPAGYDPKLRGLFERFVENSLNIKICVGIGIFVYVIGLISCILLLFGIYKKRAKFVKVYLITYVVNTLIGLIFCGLMLVYLIPINDFPEAYVISGVVMLINFGEIFQVDDF